MDGEHPQTVEEQKVESCSTPSLDLTYYEFRGKRIFPVKVDLFIWNCEQLAVLLCLWRIVREIAISMFIFKVIPFDFFHPAFIFACIKAIYRIDPHNVFRTDSGKPAGSTVAIIGKVLLCNLIALVFELWIAYKSHKEAKDNVEDSGKRKWSKIVQENSSGELL